ncbi:MAG: aminoglycoside phosphotransferase family protein [Lentisphaerae bacterium]|nr:aminoglycoside phosphotransferase family protein [Lentisphaerota bacterium]
MIGNYIGKVSTADPLYEYLRWEIFPQVGADARDGIRVFETNGSNAVYIYEDRATGQRVVGKFFYSDRMDNWEVARRRLNREYNNINEFRQYLGNYHYVARTLGRNETLNCLLVIEFCQGTTLDKILTRSFEEKNPELLYQKLTALAYFLATVHNRSARPEGVDFYDSCSYFDAVMLGASQLMDSGEYNYFMRLKESWISEPAVWQDQKVLTHGDATPSNFLFGDGLHVISFDLERARRTDRVFDVGRIAAELQHYFLRTTGNKYAAEPFIGHFLWEYACHFPDRESAFDSICKRVPFYFGTNLLRISRNSYLDRAYRRLLIEEAKLSLKR